LETIHTIEWMKQVARQARAEGRSTGFVPTMGALHAGHLSLVRAALAESQPVVASIFVNPTQFGPSEDFRKYPRTIEVDGKKLEDAGVDYLFAPDPSEIYPQGFRTWVNVEDLSERLEGRVRQGHFRGVTTVVLKLLEIVQPQKAFFGRKDAQQARIIKQMARDLHLDSEIVVCPIVREPDGLAMSSRNAYLELDERRAQFHFTRGTRRAAAHRRHARSPEDRAARGVRIRGTRRRGNARAGDAFARCVSRRAGRADRRHSLDRQPFDRRARWRVPYDAVKAFCGEGFKGCGKMSRSVILSEAKNLSSI
jgi:pantoate--beta-alanine ligase